MSVIARRQRRAKRSRKKTSETDRRETMRLTAYHCPFCHHWHVGSDHGLTRRG